MESWSGKDRTDENFPVGVLVSGRLRPEVHAFYAFARNADDIADNPTLAPAEKLTRLDRMAAGLDGTDAGSPAAVRLRESLRRTGVTDAHGRALLAAFRQDAVKTRYASWEELLDYCRMSAMPVGRHVLDLHGEAHATWPPSDALCASLQILNHLQDLQRDLIELDRCYIPAELVADPASQVTGLAQTRALRAGIDALLDRCDALNAEARALPRRVRDRRLRLETAVIVGLAHRLAARLRHGDPIATRVKLTRGDGLGAALGALRHL